MKPKDLKPLFSFAERKIILRDGIFYLPAHFYDFHSFSFPSWSDPLLFGNNNPVAIEFCSGNGAWIEQRALSQPLKNWVAVEKRFDRIRKIWSKKKNQQINNLFAVCGEGNAFATHFIRSESISEVYINFPDPWPKQKHAKHRIMKASFIKELARIIRPEGSVTFVTDDTHYREQTDRLFKEENRFELISHATNVTEYGSSYFDTLWRSEGRTIYYAQYRTRPSH